MEIPSGDKNKNRRENHAPERHLFARAIAFGADNIFPEG